MAKLLQSLGRLSIRGYLMFACFIAIAFMATYSKLQSQIQLTLEQAQQHASEQARTKELSLKNNQAATTNTATSTPVTNSDQAAPVATSTTESKASAQSSMNASAPTGNLNAVIKTEQLKFSLTNLTLTLGGLLPKVVVSTPDGLGMSAPTIVGDSAGMELVPTQSTPKNLSNWQMRLSGTPKPGTYHLKLRSTAQTEAGTVEYIGNVTVLVLL